MKTIAVLTDFSAGAEHAAMYALHLARKIGANVVLYNICPLPVQVQMVSSSGYLDDEPEGSSESWDNLQLLSDRLKRKLKEVSLPGEALPEITFDTCSGYEIVDLMISLSNNDNLMLIIKSPSLNDKIEAYIQGDDCRRIVDWATVPVLVVPDSTVIRNPEKIAFVSELAKKDAAYINLLVNIAGQFSPEIMVASMDDNKEQVGDLADPEKNLVSKKIIGNVDYGRIYHRNIPVDKQNGWQWLRDNKRTDMLTMVQRPQHALKDFFKRGSCSSQVTHHITIPVLIFPAVI